MGASYSNIDAATEISVDGTVLWLPAGLCLGIHSFDEFPELPISPNDGLEIQPTAMESVPDQHVGINHTDASLTNASQSPEYTMPRRAFSNKLSTYISSAWRSMGVIDLYHPTPDVFRLLKTLPTSLVGKYAVFFLC